MDSRHSLLSKGSSLVGTHIQDLREVWKNEKASEIQKMER